MRQRTAFERLALPHMAAAYNLAYWLTRSRPDADDSAETLLIRSEEHGLLLEALAALAPAFREILVLREIEEMSYGEIAAIIGSPVGTVMSRLSRARTELRARIKAMSDKDDRNAM